MIKNCKICEGEFSSKPSQKQKYCSHQCYSISLRTALLGSANPHHKERIIKYCGLCNKEMRLLPSRARKYKYCSRSCARKGNLTPELLESLRKNSIFNKWKGPLSPTWKGGKTPTVLRLRECTNYKLWRKAVYERDKYICKNCGQVGGNLNADHIIPFAKLLDLINKARGEKNLFDAAIEDRGLWDVNNGQTLCHKCHKETKSYGCHYRKDNTSCTATITKITL